MFDLLAYAVLSDDVRQEYFWKDHSSNECSSIPEIIALVFAVTSSVSNIRVAYILFMTNLWNDLSYRNLFIFLVVVFLRHIVLDLFLISIIHQIYNWVGMDTPLCRLFGVYGTFLNILEMETLTHVCIERFVVARYNDRGWPINRKHYLLYLCSSICFAGLYTYLPIFSHGGYWYEDDCKACTFDILLPDVNRPFVHIIVFFLRTVKPVIIMIMSLVWARHLEQRSGNDDQIKFTKNVIAITVVNMLCWLPLAVIKGFVMAEQLYTGQVLIDLGPYVSYYKWALFITMLAPGFNSIALIICDKDIRDSQDVAPKIQTNPEQKRQ